MTVRELCCLRRVSASKWLNYSLPGWADMVFVVAVPGQVEGLRAGPGRVDAGGQPGGVRGAGRVAGAHSAALCQLKLQAHGGADIC